MRFTDCVSRKEIADKDEPLHCNNSGVNDEQLRGLIYYSVAINRQTNQTLR